MRARAFTLIELLVVIAIIALLIGILLPALAKARCSARKLIGGINHRTISQAMYFYAEQYDDFTPVGHSDGNTNWYYAWPAQLRTANGGIDSGFMQAVKNPVAPAEFDTDWRVVYDNASVTRRAQSVASETNRGVNFGYLEGEVMVRRGALQLVIGNDPERNGIYSLSIGMNEVGTSGGPIEVTPGNFRLLGVGQHAITRGNPPPDRKAEIGVKFSSYADPSNFITFADSRVDGVDDPIVSAGSTGFYGNLIPASYCNSSSANFSFADGHVESLVVRDNVLTDEVDATRDDPNTQARMRRWNADGRPNIDTWIPRANIE